MSGNIRNTRTRIQSKLLQSTELPNHYNPSVAPHYSPRWRTNATSYVDHGYQHRKDTLYPFSLRIGRFRCTPRRMCSGCPNSLINYLTILRYETIQNRTKHWNSKHIMRSKSTTEDRYWIKCKRNEHADQKWFHVITKCIHFHRCWC